MEHYKDFLRFPESVRWKWLFNKLKDPTNIDDEFVSKPWDTKTHRKAPFANDAPELEAFLSAIEKDVRNPDLRRKVKCNLNQSQLNFIREVKEDYPRRGLRVRMEDKGSRFVIEDAVTEDNQIAENLSNPIHFRETANNPLDEYIQEIKDWADAALETGEIDDKQYKFISNIDDAHLANPKPLYKTHKTDEEGNMLEPIPIRNLTVGCGTPVHPLSKLCQLNIEHLTSKKELPRNCKSTKEVLKVITEINENMTPLPDAACLVLPDAVQMYPNVDTEGALDSVHRRLQTNPSPLGLSPDSVISGLRICLRCNCVQFKEKYYLPKRGVAMGACHACDFSDIWMGDIAQMHVDTCPVDTLHFILYRDDGLDVLLNGEQDLQALHDHMNSLHPNLTWTVKCGREGGYLDLWLMIENGKIEWKNYKKTPAVYVGPDSCHDPMVRGAIVKGVGHRLRVNSSKDEYFEESVEDTARAFKISGYNYQETKKEMLTFLTDDPLELIKKKKTVKKKPSKGVRAFFISKYDPRMPHPRLMISRNYHHLANHPILSNLFPRENLVGGTRRQPNLSEILSPTVQQTRPGVDGGDDPGDGHGNDGAGGAVAGGRWNGSYHCPLFKTKGRCDVCTHMVETSTIYSPYFQEEVCDSWP